MGLKTTIIKIKWIIVCKTCRILLCLIVGFSKCWHLCIVHWIILHWCYCFLTTPTIGDRHSQTYSDSKSFKTYLKAVTIQLYLYDCEVQLISNLYTPNLMALSVFHWKVLACSSGLNLWEPPDIVNAFIFLLQTHRVHFHLKKSMSFFIAETNGNIKNSWKLRFIFPLYTVLNIN